MGEISILTEKQKIILAAIVNNDYLNQQFYFTGGTALAEVYLKHRLSEDLDFFTSVDFDREHIFEIVNKWSKEYNFMIESRSAGPVQIYNFQFENGEKLKVDFGYYPHPQVENPNIWRSPLKVDSFVDIGVNKLLTLTQRTQVKDFVDLFFLLQQFTFWDLREGVRGKFRVEIEPFIFASDLLMVEDFTVLPRMLKPLTLVELKTFFREMAKSLGQKSVT